TLRATHKVSGGRAALAALLPPGLLVASVFALYAYFLFNVISSTGSFATSGVIVPRDETKIIVDAMLIHAEENADRPPRHAIELVAQRYVTAWDLTLASSQTMSGDVPVGGITLDAFAEASSSRQAAVVQAAIQALPEDVVAHRLGDFVFTCHGIDWEDADPGLWIVIASPDPGANPNAAYFAEPVVGRLDGTCESIPKPEFEAKLIEQNALRAKHGLPPLPFPERVRHGRPAVARGGGAIDE
ncbi:MAG: hypothetical protein ABII12_18585, partial [Planctomycetota bacterium]